MNASRRRFLGCLAAGAGAISFRRPVHAFPIIGKDPEETFFQWKPVSEDVWIAFGQGGNTLVLAGKGAAVLVDCKNAPFGAALRREAEAQGAPIKLVVNTHHHGDHTGGNHAFSKDLAIVAHEKCKPRIAPQMNRYISQAKEAVLTLSADERPCAAKVREDAKAYHNRMNQLKPAEFEPKITVGDSKELETGGEKIILRHFGPGHTDNDLVVFVPRRNVVHCGDLLFYRRHPFLDRESGGTFKGWMASVLGIVELCDEKTLVVPGHGELTNVKGLREQVEYWERTRDAVAAAIKEGKSKDDVQKLEIAAFKDYGLPEMRARSLAAVYEELTVSP